MTTTPLATGDLRKYFLGLKSLVAASEEYVFLRNTFIRLCVFTAIVIFTLAANALIGTVAGRLPDYVNWVLAFVELLILLADALWFTVSLTKEIAEWLEKLGITAAKKGGKPAVIIVILLSIVAAGGLIFRKEANKAWLHVDAVTSTNRP